MPGPDYVGKIEPLTNLNADEVKRKLEAAYQRFTDGATTAPKPRTGLQRSDLDEMFKYHAPTPDQQVAYEKLRGDAKAFALAILELVPNGPDQTAAIRLVRQAVMTANSGIALGGRY